MRKPVRCVQPLGAAIPIVLDSPHSGRHYPADFYTRLTRLKLQHLEDGFVDELFAHAPSIGATLVAAEFPRTYIDPNRAINDIDQSALADAWPGLARPWLARPGMARPWLAMPGLATNNLGTQG